MWKNREFASQTKISSNQDSSYNITLLSEKVDFTEFLLKISESKISLFPHHTIFFRQINSLVIYLVNALLSRNFCQNSLRANFRNFHTELRTFTEFTDFKGNPF